MKRTITEILVEVEETIRVRKIKRNAADEEKHNVTTVDAIVCPFCGRAFSPAENLEKQNELEKQHKI